jgi:hypothetical protein
MPTRSRVRRTRFRARTLAVPLTLLTLLTAADASAQQRAKRQTYGGWPQQPLGVPVAMRNMLRPPINETEPNNTAGTSNTVQIGDDVSGAISPALDVDYFMLNIAQQATLELEIFAQRQGSPLDPILGLYSASATLLAENDDTFGLDSRIRYTVAPGIYFVQVRNFNSTGGDNFTYRLHIGTASTAPGDPTTLIADGIDGAWSTAAGPNVLYVVQQNGGVVRVAGDGTVSDFFNDDNFIPYDVAIDGFGRVLVAGMSTAVPERGFVKAINPATNETINLIGPIESAVSVTVGADGDVYVANTFSCAAAGCSLLSEPRIHRFDPRGVARSTTAVTGTVAQLMDLAFSPAGLLHYSNINNGVYRIPTGQAPQRMITATGIGGLAFDRDGNIYLGTASRGITLYGANYQSLNDPFASSGLNLTGNVVFARDAGGAMTSRLLGINLGDGSVREVNSAGVRAPGFRIGTDLLLFATDSIRRGVMGGEYGDTLRVEGITTGLTWSITSGALPPGISLNATTGALSGIPQTSGTYTFSARAEGLGRVGVKEFLFEVIRPIVERGAASEYLLGVSTRLSPTLQRFMDLQGNKNGRFDIGDLRAYLRAQANAGGGK